MRRLLAPDPILQVDALGLHFPSPLLLAAGFDRNAEVPDALGALGFGGVEIGTVTGYPQAGNPSPRLFRLPLDRALINRVGFANQGAFAVASRLGRKRPGRVIVGASIAKSRVWEDERAIIDDYVISARWLSAVADYLVVNVSSPNTPGVRDLQAVARLRPLLSAVREEVAKPVLVKISPDLEDGDLEAIADLAVELGLEGNIATNTTLSREGLGCEATEGGLSGAPLKARALRVLRHLHARVGDRLVLVASGGIMSAEDVWERLQAGATLVQAYTGLVYGGPLWPWRVNRDLASRLRAAGPHL